MSCCRKHVSRYQNSGYSRKTVVIIEFFQPMRQVSCDHLNMFCCRATHLSIKMIFVARQSHDGRATIFSYMETTLMCFIKFSVASNVSIITENDYYRDKKSECNAKQLLLTYLFIVTLICLPDNKMFSKVLHQKALLRK